MMNLIAAVIVVSALSTSVSGSAVLHVYYSSQNFDNAVVTDSTVATLDASYAYFGDNLWVASDVPGTGLIPLTVYANKATHHHITTASSAGIAWATANGYSAVGLAGYVYADQSSVPSPARALPLEMWYSSARGDHFLVGTDDNRNNAKSAGYVLLYTDCWTNSGDWVVWPNSPQPDMPFLPSSDLTGGFQYLEGGNAQPPGIGADTWYPSWGADGRLYSSWTDGHVDNVTSGSGGNKATTGFAIVDGDDPFNLTLSNVATYAESAAPYEGRYPSLNHYRDKVWYYGTYSLENYGAWPSPAPNCGNWCIQGPFASIRTSTNFGENWTDSRRSMLNFTDNLFGESAFNNSKVKFGAPHAIDFGQESKHAPGGNLYMVGHGAETPESHQSWMQGDSVYLSRTVGGAPNPATINTRSAWEFRGQNDQWVAQVSDAQPLFVWPGKTGVVTMTYHPTILKYIMVISTPTSGCSTVGNFDTYFLESDAMSGPFYMVTYLSSFGPEAYFVHIPSKFMAANVSTDAERPRKAAVTEHVPRDSAAPLSRPLTRAEAASEARDSAAYYDFFLSYSADFASGKPNPPGSGYHWSLLQSRIGLSAAFQQRLKARKEGAAQGAGK